MNKFILRQSYNLITVSTLLFITGCGSAQLTPSQPPENVSPPLTSLPDTQQPVAGWLGFVTAPQTGEQPNYWSPSHPDAEVVMFSSDWSTVEPGTSLIALAPEQNVEIRFNQVSDQPYGCDDIPTPMAGFSATQALPEGVVWVLEPQQAENATAIPLIEKPKTDPNQRTWQGKDVSIQLIAKTDTTVELNVIKAGEIIDQQSINKIVVEGVNDRPIDLYAPYEIGIAQPIAAFQLNTDQILMILWSPSLEGHQFKGLSVSAINVEKFDINFLYYCAF